MRPHLIALLITTAGTHAHAQSNASPSTLDRNATNRNPSSVSDMLTQARKLAEELEYPRVVALTESVIEDSRATPKDKLDAYLLLGSAQAFIGNPLEAESAFRFLLRGRPDFEFPEGTSPKITWVFRKVQHEEREILKQTEEMRRARVASAMKLGLAAPERAKGGEPVRFELKIRDPFGAVQVASLHYRKSEEPLFSRLPLKLDDAGLWVASIPAEWTANERGETLEYFIGTEDAQQTILRSLGSEADPLRIALEAGQPPSKEPIYSTWWFWTASAVAVVGLSVATALVIDARTSVPDGDVDPIPLD